MLNTWIRYERDNLYVLHCVTLAGSVNIKISLYAVYILHMFHDVLVTVHI